MSQEQNPNTNNTPAKPTTPTSTTADHTPSPSPSHAASPAPLFSPRLPHPPTPDPPHRSPSLHHPSPPKTIHPSHATGDAGIESPVGDGGSAGGGRGLEGTKSGAADGAREKIGGFDWEGLEGRFWDRMEECGRVEEGVGREFEELVQVCVCGGGVLARSFFLAFFRRAGGRRRRRFLACCGVGAYKASRFLKRGRRLALRVRRRGRGSGLSLSLSLSGGLGRDGSLPSRVGESLADSSMAGYGREWPSSSKEKKVWRRSGYIVRLYLSLPPLTSLRASRSPLMLPLQMSKSSKPSRVRLPSSAPPEAFTTAIAAAD